MTPAMTAALALHQPATIALGANLSEADAARVRHLNQLRASLTDDNWPKKIRAFRALFGLNRFNNPVFGPLSPLREMLHRGLFAEEAGETLFADGNEPVETSLTKAYIHQARDLTPAHGTTDFDALAEIVDGILDTIVVGLGWLEELGLDQDEVNQLMQEVHASNMTKVDNSGAPVYDGNGKVMKGENYVKADIVGLLTQFIARRQGAN